MLSQIAIRLLGVPCEMHTNNRYLAPEPERGGSGADGNGSTSPLSDGILVLRFRFGFTS